jgi:nucleoid-associated protein YgaU
MAKAKKAQEVSSPVISPVTSSADTASPTKPVKKRTFKVAAAPTEMAAPVAAPVKAKRQPKKVVQAQPQEIQPLATESTEPPLQDLPCITISVRKIDHNGRKYYLNSEKDKLYTVQPDGGVGKYCGRLDRENDRIADFPDSDSER